jgi:hypothetical protein
MNPRNHGGKRAGSGAKRGSIYAPTRRKQALRAEWQAAVALRFGGLIEAQLRAAMGASVVVAKIDGIWTHIPDPDATILARVQTGDGAYRLTTVAPNPAMLKQIFDRLLGRAREAIFSHNTRRLGNAYLFFMRKKPLARPVPMRTFTDLSAL